MSQSSQTEKVRFEQIRILYRSLIPVILANILVSPAVVFGLWDVASHQALVAWQGLVIVLVVMRVVLYFNYRRRFTPERVRRFALYFFMGNALSGLTWGLGAAVLLPASELDYQLFVLFVLTGMGAGSLPSLGVFLPAFYAYFPISTLPVGIKLMLAGDKIHFSLGLMSIAYVVVLSVLVLNMNRAIIQSLKLRFENMDLVEQLQEQKNEAEQANISKSRFLAAASHDLRQPLHALTLFTTVLDESISYPKVRKVVDQINASVQALESLFNALLDISRLDAGVTKVEKTDFLLNPLLENLVNEYEPQATQKGLRLRWSACSFAVRSDPSLLEQILRNYLSNAIRYTETGEVHIGCEANTNFVTIGVIDSGAGIPEDEQKTIFREFYQLSNPERDRSKGLGLGLAIVQRSAKLLGHAIDLQSHPGEGSSFSITVDRVTSKETTSDALPEIQTINLSLEHTLVVVIDDEISVLEGTQQLLEVWDCAVVTATDLNSALTQLSQRNRRPDGIIADYRLGDNQTGIDAIRAIQAQYGDDTPALIVTGDIAAERLREVNNSGVQVLHKPVAPAKLRAFLRHAQLRKLKLEN